MLQGRLARAALAVLLLGVCAACQRDRVQGLSASISVPDALDFGPVQAGAHRQLSMTLVNDGRLDVVFAGATVAAPFSASALPDGLKAGASVTVQVEFAPAAAGQFDAPLAIALAGSDSLSVRLQGAGVAAAPRPAALAVAPDRLDFAMQLASAAAAQALTVRNTGEERLHWTATNDGAEVSLTTVSGDLDGGASAQIAVSVSTPAAAGQLTRHITFAATAAHAVAPVVVPVQITATAPAPGPVLPVMAVTPLALTFRSTLPAPPPAQGFTVKNVGQGQLHWSLSLAGAALLTATPQSGALGAGQSATVAVQVAAVPAVAGLLQRTIAVQSPEAATQSVVVTLDFSSAGPPPPPPQYGGSVWPKFHQGNTCTGLSSVYTATRGHLRFKSRFGPARLGNSDGTYVGSPALAEDGTIYQLGGNGFDGTITAFEPLRGGARWSVPITSPAAIAPSIEATPTVVKDGSIFVMTGAESASAHFFKMTPAGRITWQDVGGYGDGFDSSPAIGADGTLYLAYDESPGVLFFSPGDATRAPAEIERVRLTDIASDIETQSAAIADDGTGYWADSGKLWVVARDGVLWSHDATDGEFLWVHSRSAPMLAGNKAIIAYANTDFDTGAVHTIITAISAGRATGQRLWRTTLGFTPPLVPIAAGRLEDRLGLSSPALGPDGTIYIGHADGLYALDGATGRVKWHAGSAAVSSSPAVGADGTIFFGAMDGKITAVDPTGKILWTIQTGGQVNSSPAIGADGAVFAASDDGYLYAVD